MNRFIGSKKFYRNFLFIAIPIIIQQIIFSSAVIVDNLMVGQIEGGAVVMGIVFGIVFVPTFIMYATGAGSGIYITQYHGAGEKDNLQAAIGTKFRNLFYTGLLLGAIVFFFAPQLAGLYRDEAAIRNEAAEYLRIYGITLIPLFIVYALSSTYTQIGMPKKVLTTVIIGVFVNIGFNYMFIFGNDVLNIPVMGIKGAAYGTLIATMVKLFIFVFIIDKKMFTSNIFALPFISIKGMSKKIWIITIPLLANEMLWATGMSTRLAVWARFGTAEYSAVAIQQNIQQITNSVFAGMSAATAYIIGTTLGKGNKEEAKKVAYNLVGAAFMFGAIAGISLLAIQSTIVGVYNEPAAILDMASSLLIISAFYFPVWVISATLFFILRAGGRTKEVFITDVSTMWLLVIPASILCLHLKLPLVTAFAIVYGLDIVKMAISFIFVTRYKWVTVLSDSGQAQEIK